MAASRRPPTPPVVPGSTVPSEVSRSQPTVRWLPVVDFKLADHYKLPDDPGFQLGVVLPGGHPLAETLGTLATESLLQTTTQVQLGRVIARAREIDPTYRPPRFENLRRVRTPDVETAQRVAAVLRGLPYVEFAEVQRFGPLPGVVTPADDTLSAKQSHLDPPRAGVNARAAWNEQVTGEGVTIVDLERGYDWHEDLPGNIDLAHGDPNLLREMDPHHGTAVLGLVAGTDNDRGILGVAPHVKLFFAMRYWGDENDERMADAILQSLDKLDYGDVLLIDDQYWIPLDDGSERSAPIEVHSVVREHLGTIRAKGVIFVEPAGNGRRNIDPDCPIDSGAIMVGGINPETFVREEYEKRSNYGSRVDCHAPYAGIVTSGWDGEMAPDGTPVGEGHKHAMDAYTNDFKGTSATSAIVAGAACLLQSCAIEKLGHRLSPKTMRSFLRQYGEPSLGANDQVGVMPDLFKCIQELLAPSPILIRTEKGDGGERPRLPWGGCPDIEVLGPIPLPDPISAVKVTVHGLAPAESVGARLYVCPPAFFPLPSDWRFLGTAWIGDVGGGMGPHPSLLPVPWDMSNVPSWGGYSLIAVLGRAGREAPSRHGIRTPAELQRFFENSLEVGVRTRLVPIVSLHLKQEYRFTIVGPPHTERPTLEFEHELPAGTHLSVTLSENVFAGPLAHLGTTIEGIVDGPGSGRLDLVLGPGKVVSCILKITRPPASAGQRASFRLALWSGSRSWGSMGATLPS